MNVILPIGSVVKIRNSEQPVMIIGYLQKSTAMPDKAVDYTAVPYPVGNVNIFTQYGFQMTDIVEVLFEGYRDEKFAPIEQLLKLRQKMHEDENT
jgi:hypothetical protein